MTADYHLHSSFSGDSRTNPEDAVRAGIEKGLSLLCFTDHFDPDYPYPEASMELDVPAYVSEIRKLQALYQDQLEIRLGAELGIQPHLGEFLRSWARDCASGGYQFDFLIGSTHLVDRLDPFYPDYWEARSAREAVSRYLEATLENIRAFDGFDIYGHLDYVIRYAPRTEDRAFSYAAHAEQMDAILRLLIEKGKGIEINTGGWKAGLAETNPCRDVLRRYRELGGEIITMGSDAHTPEYIGYRFADAKEALKACGFRYFTVFRERRPVFMRL